MGRDKGSSIFTEDIALMLLAIVNLLGKAGRRSELI